MAAKVDKVVVTNFGVLKSKYSPKGLTAIRAAIRMLIAADKARGLRTLVVGLDNKSQMKSLSSIPVTKPLDAKQNKQAIDGIYRALTPDYIMLLGSHDVIPHQDIKNPLFKGVGGDDPDKYAWGDIPYACDAPYSNSSNDLVGPTRVVGRLPDLNASKDYKYLVGLLRTAAKYKQVNRNSMNDYFAITAQVWEASSSRTLNAIFNNDSALQKVPPRNSRWNADLIKRRVHFFNCHGAHDSSKFYGQPINKPAVYPVALEASYMAGRVQEGTIAAAECCYGGQLYALSEVQTHPSLCNAYLRSGCYGFFASTTIAYGPAHDNGQADLICRYFIQSVLKGASLGRAVLEARQMFANQPGKLDPSDFKTLAQFNLYGDPSITPLREERPASRSLLSAFAIARNDRYGRRRVLEIQGLSLQETVPRIRRAVRKVPAAVMRVIRKRSGQSSIRSKDVMSFAVQHPTDLGHLARTLVAKSNRASAYHVFLKTRPTKARAAAEPEIDAITGFVVMEVDGKAVSVNEIYSR